MRCFKTRPGCGEVKTRARRVDLVDLVWLGPWLGLACGVLAGRDREANQMIG